MTRTEPLTKTQAEELLDAAEQHGIEGEVSLDVGGLFVVEFPSRVEAECGCGARCEVDVEVDGAEVRPNLTSLRAEGWTIDQGEVTCDECLTECFRPAIEGAD